MLSTDVISYARAQPMEHPPDPIPFTANGSCSCGARSEPIDSESEALIQPCTIYTLAKSYDTRITLRVCSVTACSTGRRRYAGPDCRELGLFNLNNRILFTHDLLDEYTSSFTTSETPFVAWVQVLSRRYESHGSAKPFISEQVFRTAWFAYSGLQSLDGDMQCPQCGPTPDDTIWDGVTLAFSQKHLLPSLRPPTVLHDNAISRNSVYVKDQTLLVDKKLRKLVRKVITGRSLVVAEHEKINQKEDGLESTDEEELAEGSIPCKSKKNVMKELLERIEVIPDACQQLSTVNDAAGKLFTANFGINAILAGFQAPDVYQKLFVQVSLQSIKSLKSNDRIDCC